MPLAAEITAGMTPVVRSPRTARVTLIVIARVVGQERDVKKNACPQPSHHPDNEARSKSVHTG
jgi:hypothetical protein